MTFQLAGMRAAASTCDPETMLRCLIVDDSARFLDAARGLLERQGIRVVGVASNSAEALAQAEELRPDVTLLDIDLGGESGLELARRLHGQAAPALAPVILISTHAEQDYEELIAASPAIGFLPKTALSATAIRDLLAGRGDGARAATATAATRDRDDPHGQVVTARTTILQSAGTGDSGWPRCQPMTPSRS
jgi:DNA-binding NarL/FixJ family response regulator